MTGVTGLAGRTWAALPDPAKRAAKAGWSGYALLTNGSRLLPDFLIIGTQRGGTTSLYKYLAEHPDIGRALTKELRFFDLNYHRGLRWYRSRFPSKARRDAARRQGRVLVVGEASPDYLFHPHAARRVAQALPDVRLILLLRDPIDRAWSHYWHQVGRGHERLPFEKAVEREPERLAGELERILANERYVSYERHHHSYLARGRYAEQLEPWLDRFPRDRFFIERSEDFFADPGAVFHRVLGFLGLPDWDPGRYERFNTFTQRPMLETTHGRLREEFRAENERLASLVGREFGWDDPVPSKSDGP